MANIETGSGTVLGPLTRIVGEVRGGEDLTVLGRIEGSVVLPHTLTVAEGGIVEGELDVRALVVAGVVVGTIRAAHSVRLTPTARVVADLASPRLIIEPGAALRGRVEVGGDGDDDRPTGTDRGGPGRRPATAIGSKVAVRWPQARLPAALTGALEQVSIASLLTLMELERRTGVLELRSRRSVGQLALREGFVVSALIDGRAVPGCDAVTEYLSWTAGRFVFRVGDLGLADEVVVPTTLLLLEAARRTDEGARGPALVERPTAVSLGEASSPLAGVLEHVGVTSVLTLLEMERRVGVLELRTRRHVGRLAVREGCVTAATVDGAAVPICDAVCDLVRWEQGRFVFRTRDVATDGRGVPTTRLLLEAGRRADQNAAA
jgi:cytoskeletal protein CcmA (bactofilin family)